MTRLGFLIAIVALLALGGAVASTPVAYGGVGTHYTPS